MSAEGDKRSERETTWFIDRPNVDFDAIEHVYAMDVADDGNFEPVVGVSTAAKVGGIDSAWNVASRWGFRIGYEGVFELIDSLVGWRPFEAKVWDNESKTPRPKTILVETPSQLREAMHFAQLTPWAKRDAAAERGSWVHDGLEELGQKGQVPNLGAFAKEHGAEAAGHMRSVLEFFLYFRPVFVALEVQVASRTHRFAGRYDVRCLIDARRLVECVDPIRQDPQAVRIRELAAVATHLGLPMNHPDAMCLCLLDLKTSKGVYPETHFPQLEGYEGAGVEMGYVPTDCRLVLNTWPDGAFSASDLYVSWSTYEDFLAYLEAMRAIRRVKFADPEKIRQKAQEAALKACLSDGQKRSRDIAALELPELEGMDPKAIGRAFGRMAKKGQGVEKAGQGFWRLAT